MKIITYVAIFGSKIIENTLSTLRLIVVAKGKKIFGAILQFLIAFVWVITTGIVVSNIKDDPLKIVFFAFGSLIGSYLGSLIEEKIALGTDMITVLVNNDYSKKMIKELENKKYLVSKIDAQRQNSNISILFIITEKKQRKDVINIIQSIDKQAIISIEAIKNMSYNESK